VIELQDLMVDPEEPKNSKQSISIDLDQWELEPGQRWKYRAEAKDALSQIGVSRTWILSVLSEEELERVTQDELTLLRERLEETLTVQRDVRRGTGSYRSSGTDRPGQSFDKNRRCC
jgi:hypothetical protein